MEPFSVESPAKINLMLSIHGPRSDGFHDLTSVMAPLVFGDRLQVRRIEDEADTLRCDDPAVPTDADNLILQAARAFRRVSGQPCFFHFELEKRIPVGAGLGGGSSNAAAALKAMNALSGERLGTEALLKLAAEIGSDCAFFIDGVSARVSGRGEIVEPLPLAARERLSGQRIALFRPPFGVSTAWAYGHLRARGPAAYEAEGLARSRIESFLEGGPLRDLLFNQFEDSVGWKYLAIPSLVEQLRTMGYASLMSGSGSCCFALLENGTNLAKVRERCSDAWGAEAFFIESWLS